MTLNFSGLAAIVLLDSAAGPDTAAGKLWVTVCIVLDVVLAACWLLVRIPAHSARARAFGLWADLGTASVLLTFARPSDALISCGILVASGAFFAFYLDHRWLVAHVSFSMLLIVGFACYSVATGDINVFRAVTHADVILVAVVGLPISIRVAFLRSERRAQIARIDPLTGLLNRRGLTQVFENLASRGAPWVHCHVVDIDRFKFINDTYGHVVGDDVISAVGNLLQQVVGGQGSVARMGGEEFVIVSFQRRPRPGSPVDPAAHRRRRCPDDHVVSGCRGGLLCKCHRLGDVARRGRRRCCDVRGKARRRRTSSIGTESPRPSLNRREPRPPYSQSGSPANLLLDSLFSPDVATGMVLLRVKTWPVALSS